MAKIQTNILNKKIIEDHKDKAVNFLFLIPPNITYQDFVNPPENISTIIKGDRLFGSLITDIPLGPISLSSYLKKFININVQIIDFNVEINKIKSFSYDSFELYFEETIRNKNFKDIDYIGISALFTPAYDSILILSALSKKIFTSSLLLVGGNFPTAMYRNILNESPFIDAICYGEGEIPLLDLILANDKKDFLTKSSSWITHKKLMQDDIKLEHNFIWDLDEIPFLDYDILDLEGYKLNPTSSRYSVKEKIDLSDKNYSQDTVDEILIASNNDINYSMPIMTSRGCPFKCTFCASHAAHGRDMRYYSHERVMNDIKKMIENYGIDGVVIQDDHFMAGKYRPYKIVKEIGELNLGMFFQNALAIYALDYEFLKLLKDSGVNALVLPIESGSARVLKELMKKPLRLDIIPRVLKDCRDAGIYTDCNIILGMPGETTKDINDSREFLKNIYADWFRVFVATPIPGSEMFDKCHSENLFEISPLNANYKRAVVSTEFLKPEEVQAFTYLMNIELNFVFNSNIRLGNYLTAIESFQNVINVKPDHSIAHYYISLCYDRVNNSNLSLHHLKLAQSYRNSFWDYYINYFNIPYPIN